MRTLLLYTLIIICITTPPILATEKYSEQLFKIEEELYGIDYSDQSTDSRLARLEQSVYGVVSNNKNIDDRIKRLSADLSADVFDEKITPGNDSFDSEEIAEEGNVNYPALDTIETKLFNKPNLKANLNTRIVKIEKHLFNQTYDKEDYYSRVERIKNNIFKDDYRLAGESLGHDSINYTNRNETFDSDELSGLNRDLFNMNRSSFANRLAELENQVLGGAYEMDSDEERLDRINGAYKAQKSIKKYDSNKFQQGMSTVMQVGAMLLMVLCMVL